MERVWLPLPFHPRGGNEPSRRQEGNLKSQFGRLCTIFVWTQRGKKSVFGVIPNQAILLHQSMCKCFVQTFDVKMKKAYSGCVCFLANWSSLISGFEPRVRMTKKIKNQDLCKYLPFDNDVKGLNERSASLKSNHSRFSTDSRDGC